MLAAVPTSPLSTFGNLVLLLALVAACYSAGAAFAGSRIGRQRWVDSSVYALYAATGFITIACVALWYGILTHDYTIKYVQHYSDTTMPTFYKITALWGGLDGSILFWVWLLAVFSSIAVAVNRSKHRELIGYVVGVLMTIATFFLLLIVFWGKNPFSTYLTAPPIDGKGLNPLLQTYWMAIHPPSLYLGYVGMSIPFAFCIAALLTGNLDDSWLAAVRRWVLFAWFFLCLGLTLGGIWAYEELGWGGMWAWDPVENAGLLPWLTATAFLHSIMIQERRGMFRVWNVALVIITFFLTIFGTFMTRSGIVQSVHAFGQDNELAYLFLIFMAILLVLSFGLLFFRLPQLRSGGTLDSWLSREFMFLTNNWILLSAAFFVLFATMFPTLAEHVTGERITVGQEFFNLWMVPIGLVLLLLTGIGPIIAWKRATAKNLVQQFLWPTVACAVTLILLAALVPGVGALTYVFSGKPIRIGASEIHLRIPAALICFGFCAFTLSTIIQEYVRGGMVRRKQTGTDFFTSVVGLSLRNRRRYGGYIVHLGIVVMFVGFAGHAYHTNVERTLRPGDVTYFAGYKFVHEGFEHKSTPALREQATATIGLFQGGERVNTMHPEKRVYAKSEDGQPTTEVALWRRLEHDVYLVLNNFEGSTINLKIQINPLINWIWLGFGVLALGTFIVMLPEWMFAFLTVRERDKPAPSGPSPAARVATLLAFLAGAGLLMYGSKLAFGAEAPPPEVGHTAAQTAGAHVEVAGDSTNEPRSEVEKALFKDMVCMCGGCGRQTLLDCRCGYAHDEREKVRALLAGGANYDQVVDAFVQRYGGQHVLVAPRGGLRVWNWIVPMTVIVAALGLLAAFALRLRSRRLKRGGGGGPGDGPGGGGAGGGGAGEMGTADVDAEERLEDELSRLD